MQRSIGFIGVGNMGRAMVEGIAKSRIVKDIYICDHHIENLIRFKDFDCVHLATDAKEVASQSDVLVLSIKPYHYKKVLQTVLSHLKQNVILVDIAAGITIQDVKTIVNRDIKVIKAMPNTPALVQQAMTAICFDDLILEDEKKWIQTLFSSFGRCEVVEESLMDAVTCVSGSSPAYVFMMIEAMADAAVKQGMKRKQAYIFAAQAVLGSAQMVLETKMHPAELKDMVCSPQGTTIDGVYTLERTGFRASVMEAMEAVANKSKEMTRK